MVDKVTAYFINDPVARELGIIPEDYEIKDISFRRRGIRDTIDLMYGSDIDYMRRLRQPRKYYVIRVRKKDRYLVEKVIKATNGKVLFRRLKRGVRLAVYCKPIVLEYLQFHILHVKKYKRKPYRKLL